MIDKIYIESAKSIHSEFVKLQEKLNSYSLEYEKLSKYFEKTSKEIEEYTKKELPKIKEKADIENVAQNLFKRMDEISDEEKKLVRLVTPITDRIEKLKQEELILFEALKNKYPHLSIEIIKDEIQKNLK